MPTAAITTRRRRLNVVKRSALTLYLGKGYADGPRRRISSGPDGLVYADGPVGIYGFMPTAFLRLRSALGRRHSGIYADGCRRQTKFFW